MTWLCVAFKHCPQCNIHGVSTLDRDTGYSAADV